MSQLFKNRLFGAINFEGILGYPNHVPEVVRDCLPKFTSFGEQSAKDHLQKFVDLIDDHNITHEDVLMTLFTVSLSEISREWFKELPRSSIGSMKVLEDYFIKRYGDIEQYDDMEHSIEQDIA